MAIESDTIRTITDSPDFNGGFSDIKLISSNRHSRIFKAACGDQLYILKAPATEAGLHLSLIRREWEVGRGLAHPGLARMFSYEAGSPVGPCIVMEYVNGRTLSNFIAEGHSLRERKAVFRSILDTVRYLHRVGIVHNDLKPDNILVAEDGNRIKIVDFGLSDDDAHFFAKSIGGTEGYMSPELRNGEKVDARSDIWSLGAIMKDLFEDRFRHIRTKCLSEDRNRRYASVNGLISAWKWRRWRNAGLVIISAALISAIAAFAVSEARKPHPVRLQPIHVNPDLSCNGTANCYIVPSAGDYSFDATVQGPTSIPVEGTAVKAEVLWETFGTDRKPETGDLVSSVSYSGGRVSFHATGTDGNAVIAIKDGNGTILWSWHIWCCTGYDPVRFGQQFPGLVLMDRNLGATSCTPGDVHSLGLFYHYGRKDPFLGSAFINKSLICEYVSSRGDIFTSSPDTSLFTRQVSISKPTMMFSIDGFTNYDKDLQWDTDKNGNDPCPPGWKVPSKEDLKMLAPALKSKPEIPWDKVNRGTDLAPIILGPDTREHYWFPATGDLGRKSNDLIRVGIMLSLHTTELISDKDGVYTVGIYVRSDESYNETDSTAILSYITFTPYTSFAVRCCKE